MIVRIGLAAGLAALLTFAIAAWWPAPAVDRATLASVAFVPIWTGLALASGLVSAARSRPGSARRRLVALHRRLGGGLLVVALVVFGSGVGALLDRSLAAWQLGVASPDASVPALAEQPLDRVLALLLAEQPELAQTEFSLRPATPEQPWIQVDFFDAAREHQRIDFDPRHARELGRGEGPLAVLGDLHRHLLMPPQLGEPLLGLAGLALAMVVLAGLATRRGWLRGLVDLLRGRARRAPAAMHAHQWLGVSTLAPALVWAWSGAMLGLTLLVVPIVAGGAYQGDRGALMREVLAVERPIASADASPRPELAALAERRCGLLDEALPNASVERFVIRQPGRASGSVRVDWRDTGLRERGSITIAADGSLRECRALPRAGLGLQAFMIAIALHFGGWGPAALAWVYLALGSILVALVVLGGCLVIRRRVRAGELVAARWLARALVGVGLGLALASAALLVVSRVPSLARDEALARATFLGVWAAAIGFAWIGEPGQRTRDLLAGLGMLLVVAPVCGVVTLDAGIGVVECSSLTLGLLGLALALGLRSAAQPTGQREPAKEHPQTEREHDAREERTHATP